jgi:putative ABC transport system ATP-binding protein
LRQEETEGQLVIRFEHVSKIYETARGPVRALDDVNLEVVLGEFVAVRGPSGCGKSTLLMLAGGLASPTCGHVFVDGIDLGTLSARQRSQFRAESIGFVFQMFHLLPYLSVLDNVAVAAARGDSRRRAGELLERFQLADRLSHWPAQLSVGERQRVAIARALLNEPRLLLADEPTGNLDPANAASVLDLLCDFHRGGGTVLLVTHDETAARYAGRTVTLEKGAIK